tara:strand:- start:406 stop:822 length:417 start_codon:yes stop_codon:yes gene_type:complete
VPTGEVNKIWEEVKPHLQKAADYTYGRFEVEDIRISITDYDHTLWIAFDDTGIKGAVVTCVKQYPRKKYLDFTFIGGEDALTWKQPMLKVLQHWAYDNQCDGIESSGRLGWERALKADGYKPLWQTYELPIATSGLGA